MPTDAYEDEIELTRAVTSALALFDATHGQAHWAQTGYASREMHTNFAGVRHQLCRLGCTCAATNEKPLSQWLAHAKLLVLPPPAGRYHARRQCWQTHPAAWFSPDEIQDLLGHARLETTMRYPAVSLERKRHALARL